jgi:hypothetical protein
MTNVILDFECYCTPFSDIKKKFLNIGAHLGFSNVLSELGATASCFPSRKGQGQHRKSQEVK